MTSTATRIEYRFIGTTDEQTECGRCGKVELRSTVILATLDADGNADEVVYFGSTCAAKALGRDGKGQGRKVLDEARFAHQETIRAAAEARKQLAGYGLPEVGPATAAQLAHAANVYADVHRAAHWARTADWFALATAMLTRRQQQITTAQLLAA